MLAPVAIADLVPDNRFTAVVYCGPELMRSAVAGFPAR